MTWVRYNTRELVQLAPAEFQFTVHTGGSVYVKYKHEGANCRTVTTARLHAPSVADRIIAAFETLDLYKADRAIIFIFGGGSDCAREWMDICRKNAAIQRALKMKES